jgi:hypothetical protein
VRIWKFAARPKFSESPRCAKPLGRCASAERVLWKKCAVSKEKILHNSICFSEKNITFAELNQIKNIMATIALEQSSWETIQKMYPDRFVLLENPTFKSNSSVLIGGILRYKNKSIDKVIEVANKLSLNRQTVKYTGGKLDKMDVNFIL